MLRLQTPRIISHEAIAGRKAVNQVMPDLREALRELD